MPTSISEFPTAAVSSGSKPICSWTCASTSSFPQIGTRMIPSPVRRPSASVRNPFAST